MTTFIIELSRGGFLVTNGSYFKKKHRFNSAKYGIDDLSVTKYGTDYLLLGVMYKLCCLF